MAKRDKNILRGDGTVVNRDKARNGVFDINKMDKCEIAMM